MSNIDANEVENEEAAPAKSKGVQYTTVKMDDDRVVDFAGKRKMLKETTLHSNGDITVVLDFLNGETRSFHVKADAKLYAKYAGHGIEQKLGDEIAGLDDVGDCVMAIDELTERLHNGEWAVAPRSAERRSGRPPEPRLHGRSCGGHERSVPARRERGQSGRRIQLQRCRTGHGDNALWSGHHHYLDQRR